MKSPLALSPVITVLQTECTLRFGRYKNKTVAIEAIVADQTDAEFGQPLAVLTTNWEANWQGCLTPYDKFFPFPAVVLKNYSENAGCVAELEAAGVIERGGAYLAGSNGTVEARQLTPAWQAIAKQHLKLK